VKAFLKRHYSGVSWQHPGVRAISPIVDPLDRLARRRQGVGSLPDWSARIRSNGIWKQFGGAQFALTGADCLNILTTHAGLTQGQALLDIGCGAGRIAHALYRSRLQVRYVGTDVDQVAIAQCRATLPSFEFHLINVENEVYNPTGVEHASEAFPFEADTFDLVSLFSVFTHMTPDQLAAYATEIGRVLRPSGRCLFTTFLIDRGEERGARNFPVKVGPHYVSIATNHLKAVGYPLDHLDSVFATAGFRRLGDPLLGSWRSNARPADVACAQDVVIYELTPVSASS